VQPANAAAQARAITSGDLQIMIIPHREGQR
jgi:hypothetical protein